MQLSSIKNSYLDRFAMSNKEKKPTLKDHLAKVSAARQRLYEINERIRIGGATAKMYEEYQEAYKEYIDVRTENSSIGLTRNSNDKT